MPSPRVRCSRYAARTSITNRSIALTGRHWPEDDSMTTRRVRVGLGVYLSLAWLGMLLVAAPSLAADAPNCPATGVNLTNGQALVIQGDCRVQGNITLQGTSFLVVTQSTFVLTGNLTVAGGATVYIASIAFPITTHF